ncbi:hypothetical protein RclHR1_01950013 [Rhizophagus clarus]|uniref:Uncharacterized protein n=1 Tax=Rhizophagus clarus TaxID=94130 RepID=A0A2Z6R4V1_9GLOM|nr:hypothetical protein RclHR1_01950013 [Rhizophagus clarus]
MNKRNKQTKVRENTLQQEEREIERRESERREKERRENELEREGRERDERETERRENELEREGRERDKREKERREKERRERDRMEREKEERERNEESESDQDDIPPQFEEMTNQLQICNWLIANPEILNLANQMLTAKSQDIGVSKTASYDNTNNVISYGKIYDWLIVPFQIRKQLITLYYYILIGQL